MASGAESTFNWYAAFTQRHAERKARLHLLNQGFSVYLPMVPKVRRHARKVERVASPMFPRYLFVGFDRETAAWRSINGTVGVTHLVGNGDGPMPIPDGVIEEIAGREDSEGLVRLNHGRAFAEGERLRVVDGGLADLEGLFEEMDGDRRVVLLLDIMGRAVRARVPVDIVEAC